MKKWELIFKALANSNRLKIIKMLWSKKQMNVTEITDKLEISFMATSRNLVLLRNFGVLTSVGEKGHVYYSVNPDISINFRKAIKSFI